ncbi:MAG: hypothetical protein FD135_2057 [Comamonadaceae bacterium]|nr:MAG: hypothetical protein FD135_2057 [Comamonadaceae bacterium]
MSDIMSIVKATLPLMQLAEITDELKKLSPPSAANETWLDAVITFSFSQSAGGANLEGWITYYDGTKVHIQLGKVSSQVGTVAGAAAIPWVRVKPAKDYCGAGTLNLHGAWFSASLCLKTSRGEDFINPSTLSSACAGLGDFLLDAAVTYTLEQ